MTRQERIQHVVDMVALNIRGTATEDEREEIIHSVRNLGEMWDDAEAHCKTLCICVGDMVHPEEDYDMNNEDHMKYLEEEGYLALVRHTGFPTYLAIINKCLNN